MDMITHTDIHVTGKCVPEYFLRPCPYDINTTVAVNAADFAILPAV